MLIDAFVFFPLPDGLGAPGSVAAISVVLATTRWALRALWELSSGR